MRVGDGLLKLIGLCLLAGVLVAGMLFPIVGALGVVSNRASDTIDSVSADLVTTEPPLITTITDVNGTAIAYLYNQYRLPVTPEQISPTMKAALISIEDRRFYEHHGVDWKGTIRALISNQTGDEVQGASTLTQQYVKNYLINVVYRDLMGQEKKDPEKEIGRQRAQEQTVTRKLREARLSIQLEQKMSKEDILTGYLNVVEFTDRVFGVGSAAHAYFNTTPDKLTVSQSAMLAGMVNNPSLYNPWKRPKETLQRRNLVIDTMVQTKSLSPENAEKAKKEPLGVRPEGPQRPAANCVGAGADYGFFCQYVEDYLQKIGFSEDQLYSGGYTIKTTLDVNVTKTAKQAVENQVPKTTEGIANTMAIVRPGKERHEVVALVANRDYGLDGAAGQTTIAYPYGVQNKFGAGSVYKVFTAAAFLEKGGGINHVIKTPGRHVSGVFKGGGKRCPRTSQANDGDTRWYCMENSSPNYPSQMTLQTALQTSPNTGFVILEERVGMDAVVDMASRLGLRETLTTNLSGVAPNPNAENPDNRVSQSQFFRSKPNSPGNASFTLSPAPVSTLEMANVGATLMSGGVWCPPTPINEVLDRNGKKVDISEQPCEQAVAEPLADTLAQGLSKDHFGSGTASRAASEFGWTRPMLGKTGTTQDHKSAAFVGATPQLAASVMIFNDSPTPRPICDTDPPRLCGDGDIFGGKVPARTWFEAMGPIHANSPVAGLKPGDPRYLNGGPESKVPDVVGKSEQDATNILQNAGYKVAVKETNRSDPRGTVVNQSPRGSALAGELITIYVSTGHVPPPRTEEPPPSESQPPPSGGGGGPGGGGGGGNGGGGNGNGGGGRPGGG